MKLKNNLGVLITITFLSIVPCKARGTSAFLAKPQGFYSMHYVRPQDDFIKRCEQPVFLNATLAYSHSTNSKEIARALFGTDTLRFVGSQLYQQPGDLVADNFGLAPDFRGTLALKPSMQTVTLDFFYHLTLSNFCEHLFIELSAPLVFTRWNLHACESILQRGSPFFPPCEMSNSANPPVQTASNIIEALSGKFLFGDMEEPWRNGRFVFCDQDKTRLADVTIALGYNFYISEPFRLSGSILSIMPTGNHFQPTTIFYPVVGNGSHWELGASLTANAHYSWDECNTIDAYIIGTFTHPFDNQQRRSFDFIGQGPLSRYQLLEEIDPAPADSITTFTYNQQLINAINFATRCVEVDCGIEGDLVAKVTYQHNHCLVEGGYTLYGRTREHVHLSCDKIPCEVKGHFYTFKQSSVCAPTTAPHILTGDDLDLSSAEIPSSKTHTLFIQGGYEWQGCCSESAILLGISGTVGSYGCYHALNEWSIWSQFRIYF